MFKSKKKFWNVCLFFYLRRPNPFRVEHLNSRHSVPAELSVSPIRLHWPNISVNLKGIPMMSFERISKHTQTKNCRFNRNLDWILLNPNQKRLLTTGCCRDGCYHLRCYCWRDGDGGADCVSKRPIPAAIHRVSRSAIPFSFPALEFLTVYKKKGNWKKSIEDRSIDKCCFICVCVTRETDLKRLDVLRMLCPFHFRIFIVGQQSQLGLSRSQLVDRFSMLFFQFFFLFGRFSHLLRPERNSKFSKPKIC